MTAIGAKSENVRTRLQQLEAEVNALREQLHSAQRLATVGTMTAMVAHEFNNILTPIISYAQMAQTNPSLVDKALSRATDGGIRAATICRALLDVTRGSKTPAERVRIGDLVSETLDAMARKPEKDGIELTVEIPDDLEVTTKAPELQQVLLNLLINAREAVLAGRRPRKIGIFAERLGDEVGIRVADNGIGIDAADLPLIFEPFFSTKDTPRDGSPGYGLGLAFCRNIMTTLNGEIAVTSRPNEGTEFTLRLPV